MDGMIVRHARREDCKDLMKMIRELAEYEDLPDHVHTSEEILARDGFDTSPPLFHCMIAEIDGLAVGYALYSNAYATVAGGAILLLENMFIREQHRGKGNGKQLFKAIVEEAVKQQCAYMRWGVLTWNQRAMDFYQSVGATDVTLSNRVHVFRFYHTAMNNKA